MHSEGTRVALAAYDPSNQIEYPGSPASCQAHTLGALYRVYSGFQGTYLSMTETTRFGTRVSESTLAVRGHIPKYDSNAQVPAKASLECCTGCMWKERTPASKPRPRLMSWDLFWSGVFFLESGTPAIRRRPDSLAECSRKPTTASDVVWFVCFGLVFFG